MKKNHSKSTIRKKSNTVGALPQSKNTRRGHKANSCVKINSQNTQQHSANLMLHSALSKSNSQHYSQKLSIPINQTYQLQSHNAHLNLIDKPQSHRKKSYNQNAKSSIQTIPSRQNRGQILQLRHTNDQLSKQNNELKKKCSELQQLSLRDKEKIKNLIIRINEVKNQKQMTSQSKTLQPSNTKLANFFNTGSESYSFLPHKQKLQTPYKNAQNGTCDKPDCIQRKRYLQNELYRERLQRDNLERQRREWQRNRESLKQKYNQLLDQVRTMRQSQF